MSVGFQTGYEQLGAELARSVDEACDRFEEAWQAGQRPRIEKFRDEVPQPAQRVLVSELILSEVGFRQRAGETPQAEQYSNRFPELEPGWLDRVFAVSSNEVRTQISRPPLGGEPAASASSYLAEGLPVGDAGQAADPGRDKRLGRFEIRRELGRGGFGVVHLAYDPLLGREVALKVPHAHVLTDPELRSRFQREARSTAGLSHPNIVPVYEAGEIDSVGYIALAYCPGITLHDWLRRRVDSVPGPAIAEFMAVLAGAVHHAHEQGVIHRDLKPANVLLGGELKEGAGHLEQPPSLALFQPKITDFGLAKHLDGPGNETRTGTIAGTPCYMAPEQAGHGGGAVGPATDVYSLGAILYELLTGRAPFQGETVLDTLEQVRHQDPVPPRHLRPGLPRDLEIICLKCLEKDPSRRYASAKSLEEDLRRYLSGHSIHARPAGPVTRLVKLAKRRPAVAALVGVSLLAVAMLIGSDLYIRRKNQETERALKGETEAKGNLTTTLERERQALYFHRIRLAQSALLDNNVRQAERYLEACLPKPGERDLRGWEWNYLMRQCHVELITFREHTQSVQDATFSPNGKRVASLSGDGVGLVWNAATGEVAWRFHVATDNDPRSRRLAFSPDGEYLAVGELGRNRVRLFASQTGQELHAVAGSDFTWSQDGSRLATLDGPQNLVRVYDSAGAQVDSFDRRLLGKNAIALGGRDVVVATAGSDGVIHMSRGKTPDQRTLRGPPGGHFRLTFSPEGRYLAASGEDGRVHVWDVASGDQTAAIPAHRGAVESVEFSADCQSFVSADALGSMKIWDPQGRLLRALPGHGYIIQRARFSDDGRRLVSASSDRRVKIWDITADPQALVYRGHGTFAFAVCFSADGRTVASSGFDGELKVWDAATGETTLKIDSRAGPLRQAAFGDGGILVGCRSSGAVEVWGAATGNLVRSFPGVATPALTPTSLSRLAKYVAAASGDRRSVIIHAVNTGQVLSTLHCDARVKMMVFSFDERLLAVAGEDGTVKIWDVATGKSRLTLSAGEVRCLAMSRDGRLLATAGSEEWIRLWDLSSGKESLSLQTRWGRSNIYSLAFSADGRRLAAGGFDAAVMLWDTLTGDEVLELPCHHMGVTALAFSPAGQRLAAIINDGTIAVWDATPWTQPRP